jgi:hypothetical protein
MSTVGLSGASCDHPSSCHRSRSPLAGAGGQGAYAAQLLGYLLAKTAETGRHLDRGLHWGRVSLLDLKRDIEHAIYSIGNPA